MILIAFLTGMALCAAALALIFVEDTSDKFGSAVSMFAAWCAFGMLLMGGTWALGLVVPAVAAATVLVLRNKKFGEAIGALSAYKLPLSVGALVCSVLTWIGVLNTLEGLPNV